MTSIGIQERFCSGNISQSSEASSSPFLFCLLPRELSSSSLINLSFACHLPQNPILSLFHRISCSSIKQTSLYSPLKLKYSPNLSNPMLLKVPQTFLITFSLTMFSKPLTFLVNSLTSAYSLSSLRSFQKLLNLASKSKEFKVESLTIRGSTRLPADGISSEVEVGVDLEAAASAGAGS